MIYRTLEAEEPLSQGDILDDCPIFGLDVSSSSGVDLDGAPARWCERVIVLTQACDLAQLKTSKVLVALVHPAQMLVERGVLKAPTIRDQVRRGLVYGWYFLPAASPALSLAESIIDLHDLHTIPRPVIERLVAAGKRVCRLASPFCEHLAQHFAVTYMRIGLPIPYDTES
jgi:hypothetical protein